jgi:hypothetical protein
VDFSTDISLLPIQRAVSKAAALSNLMPNAPKREERRTKREGPETDGDRRQGLFLVEFVAAMADHLGYAVIRLCAGDEDGVGILEFRHAIEVLERFLGLSAPAGSWPLIQCWVTSPTSGAMPASVRNSRATLMGMA